MELQGIRLRGFKGIRHGLGVDQIELDLSGIDGLVALTGRNGAGKTTLLEQMQPFPQVVSRPNPALKNHVYLRDSEKDLSFRLNGHDYRALVKIDAQSGRSEGYLWKDGIPTVDGKISSFTSAIEALLGSPDLFFNSVFAAQGSAKLSDIKPADFKRLMAEFLRLDRYFGWEKTAKDAEARFMRAVANIERDIQVAEASISDSITLSTRREDAESEIEALELKRRLANGTLDGTVRLLDAAKADAAKAEAAAEAVEAAKVRVAEITVQIGRRRAGINQAVTDARANVDRAGAEWDRLTAILATASEVEHAAEQAKALRAAIVAMEQERDFALRGIRSADAVIDDIRACRGRHIAELEKSLESFRAEYEPLAARVNELGRKVDQIATARGNLLAGSQAPRLRAEIDGLERQAADLEKRGTVTINEPVGGVCGRSYRCNSEDCAFIRSALDAAEALPAKKEALKAEDTRIVTEITRLEAEAKQNDAELAAAKQALAANVERGREVKAGLQNVKQTMENEVAEAQARKDKIQADVDDLTERIRLNRELAARHEAAAERIDEIRGAREQIGPAKEAVERANVSLEALRESGKEELAEIQKDLDAAESRLNEAQAKAMAANEATIQVGALEAEIAEHRRTIDDLTKQIMGQTAALARIEADERHVASVREKIGAMRTRLAGLSTQAAEWAYLKTATGANGLRALEIDATAPLIARYANDLLTATYGPAHSIELRTQDDDGREVLLPVVTREDGSSEAIGQFSGGEKTWDLKALRLALTLVAKQKSGRDFRTAFADEEDGALDPEAARSFIAMYREFLRLGGFGSIFFISHKPECVGLADHQIIFNGGIHVE